MIIRENIMNSKVSYSFSVRIESMFDFKNLENDI